MAGRLYEKAKNWRDTQADIAKLFAKYAVGETQWSVSEQQKKAALTFVKQFPEKKHYDYETKTYVVDETAKRLVVQMTIPISEEGPDRNSVFRVFFWYLKSKLEALEFKLRDGSELFNFEREFFGNTMIEDVNGAPATAYDAFKSAGVELALPRSVIALPASI